MQRRSAAGGVGRDGNWARRLLDGHRHVRFGHLRRHAGRLGRVGRIGTAGDLMLTVVVCWVEGGVARGIVLLVFISRLPPTRLHGAIGRLRAAANLPLRSDRVARNMKLSRGLALRLTGGMFDWNIVRCHRLRCLTDLRHRYQTLQAEPGFNRLTQDCSRRTACSADHPIPGRPQHAIGLVRQLALRDELRQFDRPFRLKPEIIDLLRPEQNMPRFPEIVVLTATMRWNCRSVVGRSRVD